MTEPTNTPGASHPDRTPAPSTPEPLRLAQKTRNAKSWHAIQTPEEFFRDGKRAFKVADKIARGFCRRARFLHFEDLRDAVLFKLVDMRRTWTPGEGIPFGGYAIKSTQMWATGEMYRARVSGVSGCSGSRAEVESVRVQYLDAPMGGEEGEGRTYGETLDASEATGYDATPEGDADRRDTLAMIRRITKGLDPRVVDLAVAHLDEQPVTGDECPPGWTPAGIAKVAIDLRNALRAELGAPLVEMPEPPPDDDDAPAAGWWG